MRLVRLMNPPDPLRSAKCTDWPLNCFKVGLFGLERWLAGAQEAHRALGQHKVVGALPAHLHSFASAVYLHDPDESSCHFEGRAAIKRVRRRSAHR